jgi:hypothetical protein
VSWHREKHIVSVSGGVGSFVSNHPWRGILWNVVVEPTSFDTLYTLTVYDKEGDRAIEFTEQVVPIAPADTTTNEALEMPVRGPYTFTFSAVSADEDIEVRTACNDTVNY